MIKIHCCLPYLIKLFFFQRFFSSTIVRLGIFLLTLIKKKTKFPSYKEIQMGLGAKSYMMKGFLIYEEMHKYFHHAFMRRSLVLYDFAPDPSEFPNI
jgi:hypothetical protein